MSLGSFPSRHGSPPSQARGLGRRPDLRLRGELQAAAEADAIYAEAGAWRARLDELLDTHPAAASILTQMISETTSRLP
ncbi:hypothetical protein [Nonomuraea jabiensis]|uniref:hypothetical protein n=1 Tax=Nonomuraea jabiensis TaxID=882448 RepID=UPI003680CD0F